MVSHASIDLLSLGRLLRDLTQSIRSAEGGDVWPTVETTSRELANHLRVRDSPVDNHTLLGKTDLPQTLTSLLSLALGEAHIPDDGKTTPVLEILRVGANLCMDHDENRAALLEVGFPQAVVSLLEGYAETIPTPPSTRPLPLSTPHLKVMRTSIGVLLNASIGCEAALTMIKLSTTVYPPTSWALEQDRSSAALFVEEWDLRSGISNWVWRTVSALKDVQDDSLPIINSDVVPWIVSPLLQFCPPQPPEEFPLLDSVPDVLDNLVQTDFDFLEESCTLIESLALDVEDFRLELARSSCYNQGNEPGSCLQAVLQFIEHGSYPPIWRHPMYNTQRKTKEKAFDVCKAALIKAVVEVFGEEKNEEILWKDNDPKFPGGALTQRLVQWIQDYVESSGANPAVPGRDDMAICASLSLGNLVRKAPIATVLLSPPYSLAPTLASHHLLSPSTDIKLKHGILGLLKHLAQFSKLSPVIPTALGEVNIIQKIAASGIWHQKSDAMANVIQLSAIGVAKHMCNANLDQTFALALPGDPNIPTGLSQILALIKRSDSISVKSEGSRVLVNVVKSLWLVERGLEPSDKRQKKREECISMILTAECATVLTSLIGRSNRYPILVNEGIVAITLLCTHKLGASLVLEALFVPLRETSTIEEPPSATASSLPTPSSVNDGLPVPRHALDMLVYVLRNVDNPVNFPIEVRVNTCTFFLQLQRHASNEASARVREEVMPVVQQVAEESQEVGGEEKLVKAASMLLNSWTQTAQPSG
ncbi:hypothetical protein NLJ89_g1525 [Agrocybe chaxingu]|uniref:Uncharacterized protein n=1 Tax=Agrocybe chaxingu TaxID=84603 RepID=A0A9W8MZW3_9AGAR|nr:hypothetical protein NLJ89_g1525 [Agrocybe chaxingu]